MIKKLLIILLLLSPMVTLCQSTQADVVPGGGGVTANAQYKNFGTFGQPAASQSQNASFRNREGFLNAQDPSLPAVQSISVNDIFPLSAICEGNLVYNGFMFTVYGFVCSESPNPELIVNEFRRTKDSTGIGTFIHELTGLNTNTLYYVRAYASNSLGTVYGSQMNLTTDLLQQDISLNTGWNLISTYVEPDNKSMPVIWDAIKSFVTIVKNNAGQAYIPAFNINQIGNWNKYEGYQCYLTQSKILSIIGNNIRPEDTPISLTSGWKIVPYLRNSPMSAPVALGILVNDNALTIAKNNAGQVYIPAFNINQIGNLIPGQGYQMYLSKNTTLTYPANSQGRFAAGEDVTPMPKVLIPVYKMTGNNAVLLVQSDADNGSEIGVYNQNEKLIGSGVVQNNIASVTIWGDDEQTEITDGAALNSELRIMNYELKSGKLFDVDILELEDFITGEKVDVLNYKKDAMYFVKTGIIQNSSTISLNVRPNPASDIIEIEFTTPDCQATDLSIYSVDGKLISNLSGKLQALNNNKITHNISNFSSGEYKIILTCENERAVRKVVVVR